MTTPADPQLHSVVEPREVTARAVVLGVVLGLVFGAANAYLGLRVGMTVATAIPAVIMTVAVTRALGRACGIREAAVSQCIASASTSLATGAIFTLPALYLWGTPPELFQMALLIALGGILGTAAMIPLRRTLIVDGDRELPYPEGRAAADVLRASTHGLPGAHRIFYGLAVGVGLKLLIGLAGVLPTEIGATVPGVPSVAIGIELAPALLGVGYILGGRRSGVLVAGSALAAIVIAPVLAIGFSDARSPAADLPAAGAMTAGQLWSGFLRYIGAGAVALAGVGTVIAGLPAMGRAFAAVARGLGRRVRAESARHERDLPAWVIVVCLAVVILVVALVPSLLGGVLDPAQRLICALGCAGFGIVFVAVMARIAGIVGTSSQPTSGVAIVTVLTIGAAFALLGWTLPGHKVAVLCVGAIVAIAASSSGEMAQDLKTAHLVGATPAWQQLGQLLGMVTSCWIVALTIGFLADAYGFGTPELPAPQATLIRTLINGVLAGDLPWKLLAIGAALVVIPGALRIGALAFAVGLYLPLPAMLAIFVGGIARTVVARQRGPHDEASSSVDGGVLLASGLVAGEGLAGVFVAVVHGGMGLRAPAPFLPSGVSAVLGLAVTAALFVALLRAGRREDSATRTA